MAQEERGIPVEYLIYKISIMKKSLFTILAVSFASLFFSKEFSFGFFVGGLISMANFSLLSKYILNMRDLMKESSLKKARRFIIAKCLILYFIMAAALFISVTKGMYSFAGTAAGLLSIKFSMFIEGLFVRYAKSA